MEKKYLDKDGLEYLIQKLKSQFGSAGSNNDGSDCGLSTMDVNFELPDGQLSDGQIYVLGKIGSLNLNGKYSNDISASIWFIADSDFSLTPSIDHEFESGVRYLLEIKNGVITVES